MNYTIDEAKTIVESKIKRRGFSIFYYKSLCGRVFYNLKKCYIPEIKSRASLYIACHELFHCLRNRRCKVYLNEFKAERFAHRYLRHLGYKVPRKETQKAKRYIRYKLVKACNRGLIYKNVDNKLLQWLK